MAIVPKSFDDIYLIAKNRLQSRFPNSDFNEGSFNDILVGSFALAYQELQALMLERFSKTFFENPLTSGTDLEILAIDHFGEGAARPLAKPAFGILTITRGDNADEISIVKGQEFQTADQVFLAKDDVQILADSASGSVFVEAQLPGEAGNIGSGTDDWGSPGLTGVEITNTNAMQGGRETLGDEDYRVFIKEFVQSIQDGTAQGLEGTARIVNGVQDARVIRRLVDVGTLDNTGALETGANLFKFKAIRLILYVAGEGEVASPAVLEVVKERVSNQLSAGEFLFVQAAGIVIVNITAKLTFHSTNDALALAENTQVLKEAFENYINDLPIGDDFSITDLQDNYATNNGWYDLISSVEVSLPAGDIVTKENEKAIPGTIKITVTS